MNPAVRPLLALLSVAALSLSSALLPLRAQEPPAAPTAAAPRAPLKVGVTLHPYYSWTRAVVAGSDVEVRSLLPGDVDAGNYQPRAEEIAKLADLDVVVVNGLGHDDFLEPMIVASGNTKVVRLKPSDATPTLRGAHGEAANSHTFLSFTNAIQQTYFLERALAELAPQHAPLFRKNAADYARKLRKIKAAAAQSLAEVATARVATVHDGYAYLLQEFGIEVAVVIEPAHGLVPSAAELAAAIGRLQREQLRVLFSEESFPAPLLEVVRESAKAELFVLSHVATGDYTDDKFEREMAENAATIVRALAPPAAAKQR
ncbi:MAG: zinc ABC transporter substrate-binding protein [Planctomycetes bacterium]|nr:zinc ABC transporter substrate-binding protein [Planctomycetota bacterium]